MFNTVFKDGITELLIIANFKPDAVAMRMHSTSKFNGIQTIIIHKHSIYRNQDSVLLGKRKVHQIYAQFMSELFLLYSGIHWQFNRSEIIRRTACNNY